MADVTSSTRAWSGARATPWRLRHGAEVASEQPRPASAPASSPRAVASAAVRRLRRGACFAAATLACAAVPARAVALHFTDVTAAAGLATTHGYASEGAYGEPGVIAGGVAAGDYDRDGFVDLFVIRGMLGKAQLFQNRGDGTFADVTAASGIDVGPGLHASATFADVDGDPWLDLLVVGFAGTQPALWRNLGDGTFVDATAGAGLTLPGAHTFSASFGDYDRDGDLDLFLARWTSTLPLTGPTGHLWRNDGSGHFTDVSDVAGVPIFASTLFTPDFDMSFTGNFADVDSDGWPDLLVAADFGGSRVLHNDGDGTFTDVTDPAVITDENGMGAAIGDYDNDGDLDWFVSSIWDPNGIVEGHWRISGNRLYRNAGDGTFSDATDAAGVRIGYWGWGSTFADLDDDGHLDLVHVNGWGPRNIPESSEFHADPARVFLANGDGTFSESAAALGAADTGEGRGVVAFDYDRDGDLDLFYANNSGAPVLLRNDGGANRSLSVALLGRGGNHEAIGARVRATTGATTQMRELRAGSNFESQDPAEAHFGLGSAVSVDELRVTWPGGTETVLHDVAADRSLVLSQAAPGGADCTAPAPANPCIPGGVASSRTDCIVEWLVTPPPPAGPGGVPGRTVLCRDGDPACDGDGAADDACTFALSLCVNATDPRLPRCTPTDVATLAVTAPRKTSRKQLERDVHAQLARAFGPTGELGVGPSGLRANPTPDFCTTSVPVSLPLAVSASGSRRPGKLRIAVKAKSTAAGADSDVLSLLCLPPL